MQQLMFAEIERIVAFELRSRLAQGVQLTRAKLAGDLGHLRVFYVIADHEGPSERHQDALERAAGFVARTLTDVMALRRRPIVVWQHDGDYERDKRISALLADAAPPAASGDDAASADDAASTDDAASAADAASAHDALTTREPGEPHDGT